MAPSRVQAGTGLACSGLTRQCPGWRGEPTPADEPPADDPGAGERRIALPTAAGLAAAAHGIPDEVLYRQVGAMYSPTELASQLAMASAVAVREGGAVRSALGKVKAALLIAVIGHHLEGPGLMIAWHEIVPPTSRAPTGRPCWSS